MREPTLNCKTCNYALWNVRARLCPECGSPFAVRDFVFNPNAVQFKCPHCEQSYYGTDAQNGHLIPPDFDCVRCQTHISMDEMVLTPTEGVSEQQTVGALHPMHTPHRGFFRRWLATVGMSCFTPTRLIKVTDITRDTRVAIKFFLATVLISSMIGVGSIYVLVSMIGMRARLSDALQLLVGYIVGVGVVCLATLIWNSVVHLLVVATGPGKGIERTVQCVCLASGPLVLTSVPLLSFHLAPIAVLWWIINVAVILTEGHKISPWRSMLAAVFPFILLAIIIAGLIFLSVR